MRTPSTTVLPWLACFAVGFTVPSFQHLLVLFAGTVLTSGPRTVTAALRVLGSQVGDFSQYHSFFNRAHWCSMRLSRLLLDQLIQRFLGPQDPLLIVVDEHLERRRSRKVPFRGIYRDPVRSSVGQPVLAWGIRWLVFALVVPVPWVRRRWALPFLVLPLLNEKLCTRLGRRHQTVVQVTALCVTHLRRWQPHRELVLIGDGTYAAVPLANRCRQQTAPVALVSRLRLDAVLHAFPGPRPAGKRGKAPAKGERLPQLHAVLTAPHTVWHRATLTWYGGRPKTVEYATETALWYRGGHAPVPLRWVLVRSVAEDRQPLTPSAYFCTDLQVLPGQVLEWFVLRWNIEVTFAEVRAHLGFETQRYWARLSTHRVTPCLFGTFSLVVWRAQQLHPERLPLPQSAWYHKEEASFADALAAVRGELWHVLGGMPRSPVRVAPGQCVNSPLTPEVTPIPTILWHQLQYLVCYAT